MKLEKKKEKIETVKIKKIKEECTSSRADQITIYTEDPVEINTNAPKFHFTPMEPKPADTIIEMEEDEEVYDENPTNVYEKLLANDPS